jgi:hypothetical protein
MRFVLTSFILLLIISTILNAQSTPIELLAKISNASPMLGNSYYTEFEYKLFASANSTQPMDKALYQLAKRNNDFDLRVDNLNRTIIQGEWVLMVNFPTKYIVVQKRNPSNANLLSVSGLTASITMLDSMMKAGECTAKRMGDSNSEGRLRVSCPHSMYSYMDIYFRTADFQMTRMQLQYAKAQPQINRFTQQPPRLEIFIKQQTNIIPSNTGLFNINEFVAVNQGIPALQPTYRQYRFDKQI